MNRAELEGLDRDALIARAEAAGVTRARILTRPELVDELLLRSAADHATKQRSRGLFGRARDLLASVVERGLNLPDAAERIRAAAGALVAQLRDETFPVPPPRLPPEEDDDAALGSGDPGALDETPEPAHMLDDAPLPTRYDVDECVAIPVDPRTLYVYWEVRERTLDYVRAERPGGTIALRVVVVVPTWDGPRSSVRNHDVHAALGDYVVHDLPAGCVVRAAIGYRHDDAFVSIAHSPALDTPPDGPSPLLADVLVRWTPQGAVRVSSGDPDGASIQRALDRVRRDRGVASLGGNLGGWGGENQGSGRSDSTRATPNSSSDQNAFLGSSGNEGAGSSGPWGGAPSSGS
jgi:hypothetical protein